MKWFKHMSDAGEDSFLQAAMDEFGHFGYAAWWLILEMISKENGTKLTGEAHLKKTFVCRKLRTRLTQVRLFLNFCSTSGKLLSEEVEDKFILQCPKLLEIKDNYVANLEAPCKRLASYPPPEGEAEAEGELKEEVEPSVLKKEPGVPPAVSKKKPKRKTPQEPPPELLERKLFLSDPEFERYAWGELGRWKKTFTRVSDWKQALFLAEDVASKLPDPPPRWAPWIEAFLVNYQKSLLRADAKDLAEEVALESRESFRPTGRKNQGEVTVAQLLGAEARDGPPDLARVRRLAIESFSAGSDWKNGLSNNEIEQVNHERVRIAKFRDRNSGKKP